MASSRGAAWRAVVKRHGGNFKAAARVWRSMRKPGYKGNPWRDDPVGHSIAATKGWRKRGKRAKSHPKKWKSRQTRRVHSKRPVPMVLRRYMKGRHRVKVAANPSRRRRYSRRRRSVRRNILTNILTNPRRRRSYRRNPGNFLASFKQLLTMDTLIEGASVTGGMLVAVAVPNLILNLGPMKSMAFLKVFRQGWGSYLISLLAAGAASGAAAYFGKQKLARALLIGGVAGTITRIVYDVVVPKAPTQVAAALKAPGAGMLGLGASDVELAVEQAVNSELARQGIGDYLTPLEAGAPGMGDFLTVDDAESAGLALLDADDSLGEGLDPVFSAAQGDYL